MPPITHAFIDESRRMPRRTMTRMLQALHAKYLVVHSGEWQAARAQRVLGWIDRRTGEYKLRFKSGTDYVYEMLPSTDPSATLLSNPPLPEGLARIPNDEITPLASIFPENARFAIDGRGRSRWHTRRVQLTNDWFEFQLKQPMNVRAIELTDFAEAFETPSAFVISARQPDATYKKVFARPEIRFYGDQVFHPRTFEMRVVLPEAVRTDALRIQLVDSVAGARWSIHEAALWAEP
jgi:hypothetical protein